MLETERLLIRKFTFADLSDLIEIRSDADVIKNLERIVAVAQPENTASQRIMEKLGMRYEKTETHYNLVGMFVLRDFE